MEELLEAIETKAGSHLRQGRQRRGSRSCCYRTGSSRMTRHTSAITDAITPVALATNNKPVIRQQDGGCGEDEVTDGATGAQDKKGNGMTEEEDLFVWCEECGTSNVGECFIHGKVITITDNKLPNRARLSLPSVLMLKKVKGRQKDQQGVFARRLIKPRTQFGPLEAPILPSDQTLPPDIFDVRIVSQGRQERLDLSHEEACNWMMFVRPACLASEVNLAAYQFKDQIYYISTKTIHQMTELRVWYLTSYGRMFGKQPLPLVAEKTSMPPAPTVTAEVRTGVADERAAEPALDTVMTRSSAGLVPEKLECGLCSHVFNSLPQLATHICHALEELDTPHGSPRPARRKGLPRKVSVTSRQGRQVAGATRGSPGPAVSTEAGQTAYFQDTAATTTQAAVAVSRKRGRSRASRHRTCLEQQQGEEGEEKSQQESVSKQGKKCKRPRLDCQYCEESFYSEEQHRMHEAKHTGIKPYICTYEGCGKGFGSKFKHWRHSLVHEQPKNRKCPYCTRSFNRVDHLKNHMMTHDSNRKFYCCDRCGKEYLYRSTYLFHMAQHKAQEDTHLSCDICSQSFSTREAVVMHVKTHNRYKPDPTREKNHECPECHKLFTTIKDVKRHMVTHTKDRSFLCEFCPQTFSRRDHLRRHYKSNHKKEVLEAAVAANNVAFPCVLCAQVFKAEEHLQYHMSLVHPIGSVPKAEKRERPDTQHAEDQLADTLVQLKDTDTTIMLVSAPRVYMSQPGSLSANQLPMTTQAVGLQSQAGQPQPQPFPIRMHVNQHHQPAASKEQLLPQLHNITLQAAPFLTSLPQPTVGPAQPMEVVSEPFSQQPITIKTIPCRFSSQLLTPVNPSPPASSPFMPTNLPRNLRQILSSHTPQQEPHQQVAPVRRRPRSQPQSLTQPGTPHAPSTPTIVSMLAMPRQDTVSDIKTQSAHLQETSGQLKNLATQWVLTSTAPSLSEAAIGQPVTNIGDHCYATATASMAPTTGDVELKLSSPKLPSPSTLPNKVVGQVTQISDLDTLRLLQTYTGGLGVGTVQGLSSQSNNTVGMSSLQASWDTFSDLVTIPLADVPSVSSTQPSVINLPVPVNLPASDGATSTTVSLTQHS